MHANTVRSWTDQGALTCLRINGRGDRRYARQEIARFLAHSDRTGADSPSVSGTAPAKHTNGHAPGTSIAAAANGFLMRSASLTVSISDTPSAIDSVVELVCRERGYTAAAVVHQDGVTRQIVGVQENL